MTRVISKIEEFNLDREREFTFELKNTILYLVYDLDLKNLKQTLNQIKSYKIFKDIKAINYRTEKEKLNTLDPSRSCIFSLHLSLDQEINTHHLISQTAFELDLFQINPYNKIAKIFDDKYLFYVLMKANDVKQPLTISVLQKSDLSISLKEEYPKFKNFKKIMVKPRHGTEKIDSLSFPTEENFTNASELIKKIIRYDDCLIQEFIEFKKEFKVLCFMGNFYTIDKQSNPYLKKYILEIVDILNDFALSNKIIMPKVFSLDFFEKENQELVLIEANIRPAGIFRFKHRLI
jgi:glutathione synthase/RimK-type ligase-like ATP-grasp enzyme